MQNRQRNQGFTLIEILVVIVIVATIVSMALLSVGLVGEDAELDKERLRLASVIETIQDEALRDTGRRPVQTAIPPGRTRVRTLYRRKANSP
jgi:general secretion pathway protein H